MTAIALTRMTLSVPDISAFRDLASRAYTKLSYRPAIHAVGEVDTLAKLAAAGVQPFTAESVLKYKRIQKIKARGWNPFAQMGFSSIRWRACAIGNYNKPIPTDILQQALKLEEVTAGRAQLGVEYLSDKSHERDYDPFLYVQVGETRYYVGVWDEPGFKY